MSGVGFVESSSKVSHDWRYMGMSSLTAKERFLIADILEFDSGYIFTTLSSIIKYNKTTTRDIIFAACGIDIFTDPHYSQLSQQRCLERIWDTERDAVAGQVLHDFLEFFFNHYPKQLLSDEKKCRFNQCLEISKRLMNDSKIDLPISQSEKLKLLKKDIDNSLAQGTPELCLDRLHTFASEYLRLLCTKHEIKVKDDKDNYLPLHSLAGSLVRFYRGEGCLASQFSITAIRNSIDLFAKYNDVRNNQSFAHPNDILDKAEATYVVQILSSTLSLIEKIEASTEK